MSLRILVTGSRDWGDVETIENALEEACRGVSYHKVTLVHGACPAGADAIADRWGTEREFDGMTVERHPADWKTWPRRGGILRNIDMVDAVLAFRLIDSLICLAFLMPCSSDSCMRVGEHDSHGATHCANYAEATGIPVRRYRP